MTSELQRVAQLLVEVFDESPGEIATLRGTAGEQRENAALVLVDPSDSRLRDAAVLLDTAARKCEDAAGKLALAAFHGRGWAQDMVDGISPHNPPEDRPSWWPGPRPTQPDRQDQAAPESGARPAEPKAEAATGWKRHPLQDQIAVTENPIHLVPDDATKKLFRTESSTIGFGAIFAWKTPDGSSVELRVHGPDPSAPPGSNAASGVIYRLKIGRRYIGKNGTDFHPNSHKPNSPHYDPDAAADTHIPWPDGVPHPSWERT